MDKWSIAILGDGGVGKTALAVQFTLNCFVGELPPATSDPLLAVEVDLFVLNNRGIETYDPTIEDAYRRQFVLDNRMCSLEVLDTAGQEEYATLRDQWVREGEGFILVYSITSRSTFDRLQTFYESVQRAKRGGAIIILVANKCDKTYEREVFKEEGTELAQKFGCALFVEASAKTNHNVEWVFTSLVRKLREEKSQQSGCHNLENMRERGKKKCIIL